jgi:ABC-type lipoprotein export system ATPase subunit
MTKIKDNQQIIDNTRIKNGRNDIIGSKWRKWDLHIHSKYSKESRAKLGIKEIFENAIKNEIEVISITDHSNVDGLDEIWSIWETEEVEFDGQNRKIRDLINFLPGIELKGSCGKNGVHFIVIFPKCIKKQKVDNAFLTTSFLAKINCAKSDIEEAGDGDYDKGLLDVSVDLKNAAKRAHELEGIIIVHNGRKDHSFDEQIDHASGKADEYELLNTLGAEKKKIMKECIDVCEFPNFNLYHQNEAKFYLENFNKPSVVFSDSHEKYPEVDNYTWIKADPTMLGLKQIIYEPDCRVCLDKEPEVSKRVRENKIKYINSLHLSNKLGCKAKRGIWFKDVELVFNKELVAIIGNKGSGKSAISDIIGLLGDTHNAGDNNDNLTFLNNNGKHKKFRQAGFAEHFEAQLVWEDGSGTKKSLDEEIEKTAAERVRYLPQNYFESITNDLEEEKFERALRSVIFSHISESEKQGKTTFDDLEKYKSYNIQKDIDILEVDIKELSAEIISLENKKRREYKDTIKNLLEEKKKELVEHEKNKPPEVKDPLEKKDEEEDAAKRQKIETLSKLNENLDKIKGEINEKSLRKNFLIVEREELRQIFGDLNRFNNQIKEYKKQNKNKFLKYGLDIDKIIITDFAESEVAERIKEKIQEIEKIEEVLSLDTAGENTDSLMSRKAGIENQIQKIKEELSEQEKEYEEYKEKIENWEKVKKQIIGDTSTSETLEYYKAEIKFVEETLSTLLADRRKQLIGKSLDVFNEKEEIIDLYKEFKLSIDQEMGKDKEFKDKFKMNIDVSFRLSKDFVGNFLNFVNKNKKGTFYGKADSEKHLLKIFSERDLLKDAEIKEILETIIECFDKDQREEIDIKDKNREITDQIDQLEGFYRYVFSLDYLEPKYELKLDDKTLSELSPGEKGVLLLVFYLMIDKEDTPLIIDQPEDNLDNESVFRVLTHFIRFAKKRRQIIIVTHNPNLAIGADAEQIIHVNLDKQKDYYFTYKTGAIENPEINKIVVNILEGTMPAFTKRRLKYLE